MIIIPLIDTVDRFSEIFEYLIENVALEEKCKSNRYSWMYLSEGYDESEIRWCIVTAPATQLKIEVCPQEHEAYLALKYGVK
ncbi:MAG TPA: hypothetical protein VFM18_17720 [Methanosarcina sp.]|nr:hypothetical protein [Methanosarcina sp.]